MVGEAAETLLGPLKVLDLTNERGYLCGKILANLGADVIKVEKPGGDSGRRIGPFYHDIPHPERSLYWAAYNTNKKSMTLNLKTEDGRALFKKLVAGTDVVIESFDPGYMESIGLGYSNLNKINPRIIYASISPFGQQGPYRGYKDSDLVLMSMGGYVYSCGSPERPPVRIAFPQSYLFAGADAAVGILISYYNRELTGEGQFVDVAAQDSIFWTAGAVSHWTMNGVILKREGQFRGGLSANARQRQIWPCKDGFVAFQIYGGQIGRKTNRNLVQWMNSEGMANDFLMKMEWDKFDMAQVIQKTMDCIEEPIGRFFMTHSKAELEAGAIEKDIVLFPVCQMADLVASPQLRERGYWVEIPNPELGITEIYPGAWAKISGYELKTGKRAPIIGEDNIEIYSGIGLSTEDLAILREAGTI